MTNSRGLGGSTDDENNDGELQLRRDPYGQGGACEERGSEQSSRMERGGSRVFYRREEGLGVVADRPYPGAMVPVVVGA